MRRMMLASVPVEAVREEEERRMKERKGKRERGGERFVSISLTEMEHYYRYSQCCQQLQSEFCKDVCVCVIEF